jgi:hypothetical protein
MVARNISEEEVRQALAEVMHPTIDCTLVKLGIMILKGCWQNILVWRR